LLSSVQPISESMAIVSSEQDETFSALLSPKFSTDTEAFLDVYRQGIAKSKDSDRISALTRFVVKSITGNKLTDTTSEHELLSVVVHDNVGEQNYTFFIERNASSNINNTPEFQVKVSAASIPITALVSAASIPTATLVSAASIPTIVSAVSTSLEVNSQPQTASRRSIADADLELPLLTSPSSSYYVPLLPSPSRPLSRRTSHHSLQEKLTLASARVIKSSTRLSSVCVAEDRILGSGSFAGDRAVGQIVRQITPVKLSLFELGILVDVIHNDAPSYNLFQNQCYWFMLMIFEVVLRVYDNTLDSQGGISPDEYLPKLGGKWGGMLIVAPVEDVLERIERKFKERRDKEFSKVFFLLILINLISNFHYLKGV
jgi:hypothetical protein